MARPLITGQFNHIAIVAFAVPKALIESQLPRDGGLVADEPHPDFGLEPDQSVVSVAGMSAEHMRLWGVRWPGTTRFGELCLRMHVRQADRRGVLNVRRYNSSRLWTWAGVRAFGEDCRRQALSEQIRQQPRTIRVEHRLNFVPPVTVPGPGQVARADGVAGTYSLAIEASKPVARPDLRSADNWLKEVRWVYSPALAGAGRGPSPRGQTPEAVGSVGGVMVHEVLHPLWSIYPDAKVELNLDFTNLFGVDWGFLSTARPIAASLSLGSQVAIFARRPTVQVRWGQRRGETAEGAASAVRTRSIRSGGAAV